MPERGGRRGEHFEKTGRAPLLLPSSTIMVPTFTTLWEHGVVVCICCCVVNNKNNTLEMVHSFEGSSE